MGQSSSLRQNGSPINGKPDRPADSLTVLKVSGYEVEHETPRGRRYLKVKQNGVVRWFSLRGNKAEKPSTRFRQQECCGRLDKALGKSSALRT